MNRWVVRGLSVSVIVLCAGLVAPQARSQTVVDYFSWGDVQGHPLAIPGEDLEGLPDGNYLTPSEDQSQRCAGGCVLYATVGAMEMQYKIQLQEPQATINLSEGHFLDQFNALNYGMGQGEMCNSNCEIDDGVSVMSCVPTEIGNVGLVREEAVGTAGAITYSLGPQRTGFEFFTSNTSFDDIKARLLRGPIVGTIQVDATPDGSRYLWCNSTGIGGAIEQLYHRVVFVGYRSVEYMNPTGGTDVRHSLQIKNSWGKNPQGYSSYDWLAWDSECLYKEDWMQILQVEVSSTTLDLDSDGIPDHRDICLGTPNNSFGGVQRNLDNDALGDECDPDIDDDRVVDDFDCHPHNRFLAYDLDQDGACDDEELVVNAAGMPMSTLPGLGINDLITPALIDYKRFRVDGRTDDSVNHWRAIEDGDTEPGTDLSAEQVCLNECDRIAAMDAQLRPSQFTHTWCQMRCDRTLEPRDRCSPYSIPADGGSPTLWSACDTVRFCATLNHDREQYCGTTQMAVAVARCGAYWYNPGPGQIDDDGDGVADFCDTELVIRNWQVEFDTENYQLPGDSGIELSSIQCYSGEARVGFDAFGARERDASRLYLLTNDAEVAACYCPGDTWDASCDAYCPSAGELPSSGDASWNPGVDNQAWDAISSPAHCYSKLDQIAGLDHHLCDSTSVCFGCGRYDPEPDERFLWRWVPFYDLDRAVGDTFAEHPGIGYSAGDPGLIKLRVAWSGDDSPAADEKSISPQAVQMMTGCNHIPLELGRLLYVQPEWLIQPNLLYELPQLLPDDLVGGGFTDLTRNGAALAFSGDHVMAIDPTDGGLLAAQPVSYLGAARLTAGAAGPGSTTLGAMESTSFDGVDGEVGVFTPVLFHHDGANLWLGLIGFGNAWQTWEEAFATAAPAFDRMAAVLSTPDGSVFLFGLEQAERGAMQQWALYRLNDRSWERVAVVPTSRMPASTQGFAASMAESGRALYLFGGTGWSAPVHRLDVWTGQLREVVAEGFASWDPTDRAPGLSRRGDLVHLVGSSAVAFNMSTFESEELATDLPAELGDAPFVHFDTASGQLIAMAVGGAGEPLVLSMAPRGDSSWEVTPATPVIPAVDTAEPSAGVIVQGAPALHLFAVTVENAGVPHVARLLASHRELGLQRLDAEGGLLDEELTQELVNELAFEPLSGDDYYIFKVVPTGALEPDIEVRYSLTFEPTGMVPPLDAGPCSADCGTCADIDGGACSCADAGRCEGADGGSCEPDDDGDEDGGCGCAVTAPVSDRAGLVVLLGLALLGLVRLRRSRAR